MPKQKLKKTYKLSRSLLEAIDPKNAVYTGSATEQAKEIVVKNKAVRVDGTLPILPEYLRDFAFRYALENRSISDWSRTFHVVPATISGWLRKPDVLKYVMTIRYERRLRILEMTEQVEGKALKKLNEVLDQEVNPGNIQTLLTAIFKTLSMVKEGHVPSEPSSETNLNFTLNQYADNRQINVNQEELQSQLEEIEAVERVLNKKRERVALPILPTDGEE